MNGKMDSLRQFGGQLSKQIGALLGCLALASCGGNSSTTSSSASDGTTSQVATAVVSGSVSSGGNSNVASAYPRVEKSFNFIDLILPPAFAASWTCSGSGFSASYTGSGGSPYTYTPLSCSVTYANGKSSSNVWTGTFSYTYGTSCAGSGSSTLFLPRNQSSGCVITRKSVSGGTSHTLTGPLGNSYSVTHDTTTANTGYDSTTYPTTTGGVVLTCNAASCASSSLVINGTHLTGTTTPSGSTSSTWWDHTVSTMGTGLSITGTGTSAKITAGTLIVEHNLAKFTTSTTFTNVVYGDANCCFPTAGSIATTFTGGANSGKTETLTYSSTCGEATLTDSTGATSAMTLTQCI